MNKCKCNCGQDVSKSWATGHHRRGKKVIHSEETRQKLRLGKLGDLNPRFGKPGTCIGRKQTAEQINKIKEARSRQVITQAHRKAISEGNKLAYKEGRRLLSDHPFYIDGRNSGKTPIKQSFEYKEWRKSVFERDNYTCQNCKVRGGELQADHIKPQSVFPELRFILDNGRTLCRPCHMKTDTWGVRHWNNKKLTTHISVGTQS